MKIAVSISFPEHLVAEIDKLAKKERRSRSELVREAVRLYFEQRDRWNKIFAMGKATARSKGLSKRDIAAEVQAYRRSKSSRRR
jgi:CopG family transcriptional regulator / antitoxin EndoAI